MQSDQSHETIGTATGAMPEMSNSLNTAEKRRKVCAAIGKSLKSLRIAANKTQETLAFDAEVDPTYISQIERGVINPTVLNLAKVCFGLGISLADQFQGVNVALEPGNRTSRSIVRSRK